MKHYKVLKERDCDLFGYAELCVNEEKENDFLVVISGEIVSRGNNLAQQTAVYRSIGVLPLPLTEEHDKRFLRLSDAVNIVSSLCSDSVNVSFALTVLANTCTDNDND